MSRGTYPQIRPKDKVSAAMSAIRAYASGIPIRPQPDAIRITLTGAINSPTIAATAMDKSRAAIESSYLMGTCSMILIPYPSSATTFRG